MQSDPRLAGALNFRDLGGYAGHEGRRVRRGRIFRSDHLGALTRQDAVQLRTIGLTRIADLRGVTEREAAACALEGVTVHSLPIEPTIVQKIHDLLDAGQRPAPQDIVALMQDTYRGFVRGNSNRFAELFAHLLESDEPLVFHCTAGKDRTGFAAAMIHLALGVAEEDVRRDYLLTNERLKPDPNWWQALAPEVAQVLYRVQPEFLDASLQALREDFGSTEGYLADGLKLGAAERARLRELYLDPVLRNP